MFYYINSTFCDRAKKFELMIQNKTNHYRIRKWTLIDEFISHQTIQNYNSILIMYHIIWLNLAGVSMTEALISIHTYFSENFSSISNIFLLIWFISIQIVINYTLPWIYHPSWIHFFQVGDKMIDHFLFYGCGRIFGDSTFSDQNYEKCSSCIFLISQHIVKWAVWYHLITSTLCWYIISRIQLFII